MCEIVVASTSGWHEITLTVNCTSGKKITGGGGRCDSEYSAQRYLTTVKSSYPSSETQWVLKCDMPRNLIQKAFVYAICN